MEKQLGRMLAIMLVTTMLFTGSTVNALADMYRAGNEEEITCFQSEHTFEQPVSGANFDGLIVEEFAGSVNNSIDDAVYTKDTLQRLYHYDLANFRARWILNNRTKQVEDYLEITNPSEVLVTDLRKDSGFMFSVKAWETLTFDPAKVDEESYIDRKRYYEGIILEALYTEQLDEGVVSKLTNVTSRSAMEIMSNALALLGIGDQKGLDRGVLNADSLRTYFSELSSSASNVALSSLSVAELDDLYTHISSHVSQVGTAANVSDAVKKIISISNSIYDLSHKIAVFEQLSLLESDIVLVLEELCASCPNDDLILKLAIQEVKRAIENRMEIVTIDGVSKTASISDEAFKVLLEVVWGEVAASAFDGCGTAMLVGQKAGQFISNVWLSTDKIIESFYKMSAYCEVMNLIRDSYYALRNKYVDSQMTENAGTYLTIINMIFNGHKAGCEYAKEYADIINTGGIWSKITQASKS